MMAKLFRAIKLGRSVYWPVLVKLGESLAAKRHKNNKREKKGLLSEVEVAGMR
jgi:hypothetical protein